MIIEHILFDIMNTKGDKLPEYTMYKGGDILALDYTKFMFAAIGNVHSNIPDRQEMDVFTHYLEIFVHTLKKTHPNVKKIIVCLYKHGMLGLPQAHEIWRPYWHTDLEKDINMSEVEYFAGIPHLYEEVDLTKLYKEYLEESITGPVDIEWMVYPAFNNKGSKELAVHTLTRDNDKIFLPVYFIESAVRKDISVFKDGGLEELSDAIREVVRVAKTLNKTFTKAVITFGAHSAEDLIHLSNKGWTKYKSFEDYLTVEELFLLNTAMTKDGVYGEPNLSWIVDEYRRRLEGENFLG